MVIKARPPRRALRDLDDQDELKILEKQREGKVVVRKRMQEYYGHKSETQAYQTRWSNVVDVFNNRMSWVIYPLYLICLFFQWYTNTWYGPVFWVHVFSTVGYSKNIIVFGLLHRYFGHRAFTCSRFTTFVLGIMVLSGAQRGPLWYSSKHARHHKYCENDGVYPHHDPHNPYRYSWLYAYIGWVLHPYEQHIDWDYVQPHLKTWDMLLVEALTWPFALFELAVVYYYAGIKWVLIDIYATVLWLHITLGINFLTHLDDRPEEPPVNGRYKCHAHNVRRWYMKYFLDFLGEMSHEDHHKNPRRALRPSNVGLDLFFWCFVKPLEMLGLAWEVRA